MPLRDISILVSDISDISELIPLILLMIINNNELKFKILKAYFFLTSILKMYALITSKFSINNMHAYHFLSIVELISMYSFYVIVLNKKRNLFFFGLFSLLVFNILNTLLYHKFNEFNNLACGLNASIIIIFGLNYYHQIYNRTDNVQIEKDPMFFINAGFLIYASGSFFTYLFGWKILSQEAIGLFHNAWLIQSISNIIKNIVIAYGVWLMRQN